MANSAVCQSKWQPIVEPSIKNILVSNIGPINMNSSNDNI